MSKFWTIVNKVIEKSDILLLVMDARMPKGSRNPEIEEKVAKSGKKIIYVLNKCDLIEDSKEYPKVMHQLHLNPGNSIFVSAREHLGTMNLLRKIKEFSKGEYCVVGVVGYPNTGKSSVINALKGKHSARTSSQAGFTRGMQKVRVTKDMLLLDTPGVIPYNEEDRTKHVLIASRNINKTNDPEVVAMDLIVQYDGKIEKFYHAKKGEDEEESLENIAKAKNLLIKKGLPDTKKASHMILLDWQKGKIKV